METPPALVRAGLLLAVCFLEERADRGRPIISTHARWDFSTILQSCLANSRLTWAEGLEELARRPV